MYLLAPWSPTHRSRRPQSRRHASKGVSPLVLRHVHCRLMMVPSDNTMHWGGDSEKFTSKDDRNVLMYMDSPTEREAIAMTLQL